MAPSALQLSSHLRQLVLYNLDNGLLENALFIAGRLHGHDSRSPDAVHLLALCHLRLGQLKAAYDYSRLTALRSNHLGCCYTFAQACLDLELYSDGITALERVRALWDDRIRPVGSAKQSMDTPKRYVPDAAAVHALLGKLLHGNGDVTRAIDCYVRCLKLNPFMWDVFERLCATGTTLRPSNIFKVHPDLCNLFSSTDISPSRKATDEVPSVSNSTHTQEANASIATATSRNDPFTTARPLTDHVTAVGSKPVSSRIITTADFATMATPPTSNVDNDHLIAGNNTSRESQATSLEPPNAPTRRSRPDMTIPPITASSGATRQQILLARAKSKSVADQASSEGSTRGTLFPAQHNKRTLYGTALQSQSTSNRESDAPIARRSVRLNGPRPDATAFPTDKDLQDTRKIRPPAIKPRSTARSMVGRVVSGNRKPIEGSEHAQRDAWLQKTSSDSSNASLKAVAQENRELESLHWLLDTFSKLGHGYFALSRFNSQAALQAFLSLPVQQRDTPWVLAQIGKAHYEHSNYVEAEKAFARIRKMAPSRIQDMEVYSTVLWQLKNDTELAFLSHELIESDRLSPEAWCTIGNSFSLQRDHDQALKCFQRATQLDARFAYGFTLQGHEHVANEEFDKAMQAYRKAVGCDNRHYNGWYGLGKVYEKLGKYDTAETQYRCAEGINPSNSVLVTCVGVVLEKQKKHEAALLQYERAVQLAPRSPLPRFKKARMLLQLRRIQESLIEFELLKDIVPDESNVHYMLGRLYKMMHKRKTALQHYTYAMNLDPKASQYIKEAMEGIENDGLEDEDDEDDNDSVDEHMS